jgi:Protein of unknown function (DUF3489)
MTTFTIDSENQIMAYGSAEDANGNPQAQQFTSAKQLGKLAEKWPATRLVELWNSLPGQKPVKKLADRKAAVVRIWAAIQSVAPDSAAQAPTVAPTKPKPGTQATTAAKPAKAPKRGKTKAAEAVKTKTRAGSKTAQVLEMLKRPGGATLKAIMADTGWQVHSVRGFISGTLGKKMGLSVESTKGEDGERTYSLWRAGRRAEGREWPVPPHRPALPGYFNDRVIAPAYDQQGRSLHPRQHGNREVRVFRRVRLPLLPIFTHFWIFRHRPYRRFRVREPTFSRVRAVPTTSRRTQGCRRSLG